MATRNERRKRARVRLCEKSARIAKASQANHLDTVRGMANDNITSRPERNFYPSSIIGRLGNSAPRFKSSGRGTGAMSHRSAQSLKDRGKW